jgi:hypothetical protein
MTIENITSESNDNDTATGEPITGADETDGRNFIASENSDEKTNYSSEQWVEEGKEIWVEKLSKDNHQNIILVITGISIITFAGVAFYASHSPSIPLDSKKKLINYVSKAKQAGLSAEQITSKLLSVGWNKKIIDKLLRK